MLLKTAEPDDTVSDFYDVDWVNQNGEYITWSSDSFIKASMGNIFNTQVLSEKGEGCDSGENGSRGSPIPQNLKMTEKIIPCILSLWTETAGIWYVPIRPVRSEVRCISDSLLLL